MQLRQQRRFCSSDVPAIATFLRQRHFCGSGALRNNGALRDGGAFRNNGIFRNCGILRDGGAFCIQGLCEALYHERVRFLLVLAQICGCERWIFQNAKSALQKTRSEA